MLDLENTKINGHYANIRHNIFLNNDLFTKDVMLKKKKKYNYK